jgi:P27 family predicted phage terminase small subunit
MAGGRPPKPSNIKLLQGTFRKDREPEQTPEYSTDTAPPKEIDGRALIEWQTLAPMMARAGVLTEIDRNALAQYCRTWAAYLSACEEYERDGVMTENRFGDRVPSNALLTAMKLNAELVRLSGILGLDPSSRGRLNVGKKQKASTFGDAAQKAARK